MKAFTSFGILVFLCIHALVSADELTQAPRFLSELVSKETVVSEGQIKILECQAIGHPQPRYKWLKDWQSIDEGGDGDSFSRNYFYKISDISKEDAGVYRCLASNSAGTIVTAGINVSVAYMKDFNDTLESEVRISPGEAAIISLPPFESYPNPTVTWQSGYQPIRLYDIKYAITDPGNDLVILDVGPDDVRTYSARITNTQLGREMITPEVSLIVEGEATPEEISPSIIIPPANISIIKGTSISQLQCISNARPLYELETLWFKDDIPIKESAVKFFSGQWNRTLSLLDADLSYAGVYRCQVRLRNTINPPRVSAEAHVTILAMPSLKRLLPERVEAQLGKVLMLPCSAQGTPDPFIRWFRDAVDVKEIADSRYRVLLNGSLAISSVKVQDAGSFQCLASNLAGEVSTYTWLTVKTSAPVFVVPPTNQTATDGLDATILCQAHGAPKPNTTWFFNDQEIVQTSHYQISDDGDLKISGAQKEDAGRYKCVRANEAGVINQTVWLDILVKTRIEEPPSDVRVILGHVATFRCQVSHAPSVDVEIHWLHDNNPIHIKPHSRIAMRSDGTLEIQAARAADVGKYTCVVSSSGGSDSKSAHLRVIELPYAPVAVTAEKARGQSKSAKVFWTPTFDGNSPLTKFVIFKRVVPAAGIETDLLLNWEVALSNVSASANSALISDLKPSIGYQFRVSAVNNVGEGSPSHPSEVLVLPQEAPSAPPRGLVGSPRSSSEIMIQWKAPAQDERNGILLGYLVRYRLWGYKDSKWYFRNITKESQHNYLITGLITWKDYEIQVAAYNVKGVGVFSGSITVKTKEGLPEAPPRNVSAEPVSSTIIQVFWRPPQPYLINGINQGYKLQAWKEHPDINSDTKASKTVSVTPSPYPNALEAANITGLDKYTKYFITVLCFTHPGDGNRSKPLVITTLEDVPDQVMDLSFDEMNDRYVKVSWSAPESQNGILKGYTLSYQIKDLPNTRLTYNLTADVTTLEINNLTASTYYVFEVFAWTSIGAGKPLLVTIQSGVEPVLPDPPTRLAVSNIQPFSVVLQFTPGFDGNASIDLWKVEAHSHRTNTWDVVQETNNPEASSLTIDNLIPYSKYKLRLTAVNVVGPSESSSPSQEFQTLQARPSHPPSNMTVRAVSATELRVRWIPLQQFEWFGAPQGYKIKYRPRDCKCIYKEAFVYDITSNSHQLVDLEEFTTYEVTVVAVNDIGSSMEAPIALERTRESVPSAGPSNVTAEATSSTTIVVTWDPVAKVHQNGIIEGYKVIYLGRNLKTEEKVIENNQTFTTTLTELRKFYFYTIQVRAYTRQGDGELSDPAILIQTLDDVPGPPSNVSFPDVSFTYARIRWDKPAEPNGEITAYSVTYHLIDRKDINHTMEFGSNARTYKAQNLKSENNYMFLVRARTRLGWGHILRAPVYTTNNRAPPTPPSSPSISHSQVTSHSITFTWKPGKDGFAPIRYYAVQYSEDDSAWYDREERIDYSFTSYTADGLKPYSAYKFRIQSTNDIGSSEWSLASPVVRTLPAAPTEPPTDIKVIPITRTSVRVEWTPLFPDSWSGDTETGGYRVKYRQISDIPTPFSAEKEELQDTLARNVVLHDLERDTNYEITVTSYNAQGESPPSLPYTVYVGEAVPTGEPRNVKAKAVSPTEIHIEWELPLENERNGELLSCKIFYRRKTDLPGHEEVEVVSPKTLSYELLYLDTFTEYLITLLCMNPAGEGPKSSPVKVRTLESLPGPSSNLNFTDITMNSLKVIWNPPEKPNGKIVGYLVTYETARPNENFSKQVKQKVATPYLLVQSLKEEVTYKFNVKAETKIGFGPEVTATVTTGPQRGSPSRPKEVRLSQTVSSQSVTLYWRNSHPGDSPIIGYYVEAKKKDGDSWIVLMKTDSGPMEEYTISFQNLLPSTRYQFRLISYNTFGISHPSNADKMIVTPSKVYMEYGYLQQRPFYHEAWFVVTLAMASIVMIIIVVAVLCVKSKTYKYKQEAVNKTMEETFGPDCLGPDDGTGHYPAYEMQTRVGGGGTLSKRSTLNRSTLGRRSMVAGATAVVSAKSPPRPAPASVTYSDDETVKGYDENPDDSSSSDVTEKPTDISSTATESDDNESRHSEPHSFVNHYANVNDTLRQSWKRQKPVRNYSSYTDSEAEGSAVMSLNGGQIIMNNMAGSRAPLPGFSSFV